VPPRSTHAREPFTVDQVVDRLRALGDPRYLAGLPRYGVIIKRPAFGVPIPKIRALAKEIGHDQGLAMAVWDTGILDARHLAPMIADPTATTPREMDRWLREIDSWDVCDTACFDLWRHTPHAWSKVRQWARRKREYERRAAFGLLAGLVVSDKTARDERFEEALSLIEEASDDDRNFVKKAVNWALRQVGKRNPHLNRAAIAAADRIAARGTRPARWIAADALRELRSEPVQRRLRSRAPA
jgi:3-methyladenine DNA glycosylase AlkD